MSKKIDDIILDILTFLDVMDVTWKWNELCDKASRAIETLSLGPVMMRAVDEQTTCSSRTRACDSETTPLVAMGGAFGKNAREDEDEDDGACHCRQPTVLITFLLLLVYSILVLSVGISIGRRDVRVVALASSEEIELLSLSLEQHRQQNHPPLLYPKVPKHDFGEYHEYSVIHSDRSLNLMSQPFRQVMRDLSQLLKITYNAARVAIIPGSGTFGMEAVARQYATNENVMVLRNGYFSYRWTQIFDIADIPRSHTVLKARPLVVKNSESNKHNRQQYVPYPLELVIAKIKQERPAVFFAPHVETSTGMILPDHYIRGVSAAVHDVGGLLVLDCIASGTVWIDMVDVGVDVLISAPQKDWTSPPSCALVQLSERAVKWMNRKQEQETSFSLSLKQWLDVMDAYEDGGFAYHTTPPTDALHQFQRVSVEMLEFGLTELKEALVDLGQKARDLLDSRGLTSVAAPGFEAPGVLVYYSPDDTDNDVMVERFQEHGLQIAKGIPWMIDEPDNLKTFRIGLFGLDKLLKEHRTIDILEVALDHVLHETIHEDEGGLGEI